MERVVQRRAEERAGRLRRRSESSSRKMTRDPCQAPYLEWHLSSTYYMTYLKWLDSILSKKKEKEKRKRKRNIYTHMCLYMFICICMYVYACVCIYVCVYIYVYVYICICIYVCIYIYIYTYIDICTHLYRHTFVHVSIKQNYTETDTTVKRHGVRTK